MKHTKKLFSVLLTLVMALALAVPAFAAGTNSITVNNAKKGETYSIYKMLNLSVNEAKTAYSYTVNSNWTNFFTNGGAGADYVNIDSQGYVTWKEDKQDASSMEAFGLLVSEVCTACGMTYYYGKNTLAYEACFVYQENLETQRHLMQPEE